MSNFHLHRGARSIEEMRALYASCTEWIFTFGFGHVDPVTNAPLSGKFVRVPGDYNSARKRLEQSFHLSGWARQYASEEEAGVAEFKLTEIPLPEPRFTTIPGEQE